MRSRCLIFSPLPGSETRPETRTFFYDVERNNWQWPSVRLRVSSPHVSKGFEKSSPTNKRVLPDFRLIVDYNIDYNTQVMTNKLKITTVGSSVGVVLPKEILAKLRVGKGDTLYAIETPNGIELTPYNADFERRLEIGKRVMRENRDLLRKLAE